MVSAKAYKVQDVDRKKRVGIVANSLANLKHKGATKLAVPGDCRVCLEDGTDVDDEIYCNVPSLPEKISIKKERAWPEWSRKCWSPQPGANVLSRLRLCRKRTNYV